MAKRLYGVNPIERFNQKYIIDLETGCWNWQDSLDKYGYGQFSVNAKMVKAHRFAYQYYVGSLIDKLELCHTCQNRKCCNPDHLRQDTKSSNMIDMVQIGNSHFQKLSVEEVEKIKKELEFPYRGQINDLAHFYKVERHTISHIKRGTTWSHIKI